jgi:predicted nucleic acid-binding protein
VIVVADTSPITTLLKVNQIDLLFDLFDEVIVPTAVRDELLRKHTSVPRELKIVAALDTATVERLKLQLDIGEAEAITLTKELHADALLIDEKKGRRIAAEEGLTVVGLLAVIVMARERRLIASVKDLLEKLQMTGGFYVSESMRLKTLREAGEI